MNIQIWLWSIVALVFLTLEIGHPGLFYFISFCLGALNAALFAFLDYSLYFQAITFFISTIVALFILRMCVARMKRTTHATNVYALVGKKGIVIEQIAADQPGYVKIQGEQWLARSKATVLPKGCTVTVIDVRGAHLIVDQTHY